jgi:hypothetical protein
VSWTYKEKEVIELPVCAGFVYKITNLTTGRAYIGKKLSHFTKYHNNQLTIIELTPYALRPLKQMCHYVLVEVAIRS